MNILDLQPSEEHRDERCDIISLLAIQRRAQQRRRRSLRHLSCPARPTLALTAGPDARLLGLIALGGGLDGSSCLSRAGSLTRSVLLKTVMRGFSSAPSSSMTSSVVLRCASTPGLLPSRT